MSGVKISDELAKSIEQRRWRDGAPAMWVFDLRGGGYWTTYPILRAVEVLTWLTAPVEVRHYDTDSRLCVVEVSPLMCLVEELGGHRYAIETDVIVKYWRPVGTQPEESR